MQRGSRKRGYAKAFRVRPPFPRPKIRRVESYARFYGLYKNKKGEVKRMGFYVKINPRYSNRLVGALMRAVCKNLIANRIPEHRLGQTFRSFTDLMLNTRWITIKRLLQYEAGVRYVR